MKALGLWIVALAVLMLWTGSPAGAQTVDLGAGEYRYLSAQFHSAEGHTVDVWGWAWADAAAGVPSLGVGTNSDSSGCVQVSLTNGFADYGCGQILVAIDPVLQLGVVSGTVQGSSGPLRFAATLVGTGTPQTSSSSGAPPDAYANAWLWRNADSVGTVTSAGGEVIGQGTGYMEHSLGLYSYVG